MQTLEKSSNYASFFEQLRCLEQRVLLLDYDGTLAPFRKEREQAYPYAEVPNLLNQVQASGTRLVLVSGRRAREVAVLCGTQPTPEIWGSHGLERLHADGTYTKTIISEQQSTGLHKAALWVNEAGLSASAETKQGSIAVHWRGQDAGVAIAIRRRLVEGWTRLVQEYALEFLDFDGGIEIRVRGRHKGDAVNAILQETGVPLAIAYLGDDQTDEDAFRAIKGKGLAVLVREHARETAAQVWLKPPDELLEFLETWLKASGGDR